MMWLTSLSTSNIIQVEEKDRTGCATPSIMANLKYPELHFCVPTINFKCNFIND